MMSPIIRLVNRETVNKVAVKKVTKNRGGPQSLSGETKNTTIASPVQRSIVTAREGKKLRLREPFLMFSF
ncbi:hypothetical protein HYV21_02480 [Candidatus Microgenomates bacterium]|nr:hypothetical protein [Candidatus Microgenomates bacterium]